MMGSPGQAMSFLVFEVGAYEEQVIIRTELWKMVIVVRELRACHQHTFQADTISLPGHLNHLVERPYLSA